MPLSEVETCVLDRQDDSSSNELCQATREKLVGLIYTGRHGRSPFDPSIYSSVSMILFTWLKDHGLLRRAAGIGLKRLPRLGYLASNFHLNRNLWQSSFTISPAHRRALTRQVAAELDPQDYDSVFLQIGAMFDTPGLLNGRSRCYSYNDGSLCEKMRSPVWPTGMSPRLLDRALAYERRVHHGMAKVFTFSEYLRQSIIRNYDMPEERVVAIGGGINIDWIPEADPNKDYDRQEILFIGIDFERKGGWQLLEAFAGVREKLPRAKLHLVGPRTLNIPTRLTPGVVFHGFLSKQNPAQAATLKGLFQNSSLFVMPSLYEPYGIAPLEAMIHQIPCLVTDGWALKEIVTAGVTGDLAACGSAEDLREKMLRLLGSPEDLRRMGEAGRQKVLREHLWDQVFGRLVAQMELR